jgi:hypothetical protein
VSGKLFDNAVLEAVRSNAGDFGRVHFVFRALRPPDSDLLSAVLLGDVFAERILAALHGRVAEEEERQRRERVLERALVALFRDYLTGGFEAHHYAFFRYLWSVELALRALSEAALREEHRRLYSDLAAVASPLTAFAAARDLRHYFEAVRSALERALVDWRELRAELAQLNESAREMFLALFEKYVGAEPCGGGGA